MIRHIDTTREGRQGYYALDFLLLEPTKFGAYRRIGLLYLTLSRDEYDYLQSLHYVLAGRQIILV
jgi:hypothetical protein